MIRLVKLFTGHDGQSHVEEGVIPLEDLGGGNRASPWTNVASIRFEESPPGSMLEWHVAPHRQYVITLAGTLEFTTRDGERFQLRPGDVLLAEDTAGGGHQWRLIDDQPWQRLYIQFIQQST